MHNPIEVHRHQSRHAQSLQRLSHSSFSNLKLQSPRILIWKRTCVCLFSLHHMRELCGSAGNKPQVAVRLLRCATVRQRRHTDNTCNTSGVNDLTLQHIHKHIVMMSVRSLNFSWLQELYSSMNMSINSVHGGSSKLQLFLLPAGYMVQSQKSSEL